MSRSAAIVAFSVSATVPLLAAMPSPAVSHADEVACPAGMYWDIYANQCLYYDVGVYLSPNPFLGPLGPVGPGPVGPGPVGPGPVGPGPVGPGSVGPGPGGPGPVGPGPRRR
ncbi:MAG: hypothetical protein ACPGXI_09295 [Mycobacterium sp.]